MEQIKQEELKLIEPKKPALIIIQKTDGINWADELNNKLEQIRLEGIKVNP